MARRKNINKTEKKTQKEDKRLKNLIPFKKGQSGNPNGRPKGKKNFSTIFREGIEVIAKERGYESPDEVEFLMVKQGIEKALGDKKGKGADFRYFKLNMDKRFLKEDEDSKPQEVNLNIKKIIDDEYK